MYDPETGTLQQITLAKAKEMLEERPNNSGVFFVGQTLEINGAWFRVKACKPQELRLKAIPKPEETPATDALKRG